MAEGQNSVADMAEPQQNLQMNLKSECEGSFG
jgi:hypothetical protein